MTVKTTISLPEELFARLEREASEIGAPRSRFVAEAIEQMLKRIEDKRLLAQYNEAYAEEDPEDKAWVESAASYYRDRLEKGGE